jgi:hypothetical protein
LLREATGKALDLLAAKGADGWTEATAVLKDAQARYDANEA